MSHIVSIQIGRPKTIPGSKSGQEAWTSSIFKQPVTGRVFVSRTNLEGDEQADLTVHGGPDKAVCVYSGDHYPFWQETLPNHDWIAGSFGENLTLGKISEEDVCIGDIWQIDETLLEVSQPRQPCWKLSARWMKGLDKVFIQSGKTGWYLRVIDEGTVQRDNPIELIERKGEWNIEKANSVFYDSKEKIIVPYRATCNRFAYDNEKRFNDGGDIRVLVITDKNLLVKYVLGILNSNVIDWYYGFIGKPKGNAREYFNEPLAKIPIFIADLKT